MHTASCSDPSSMVVALHRCGRDGVEVDGVEVLLPIQATRPVQHFQNVFCVCVCADANHADGPLCICQRAGCQWMPAGNFMCVDCSPVCYFRRMSLRCQHPGCSTLYGNHKQCSMCAPHVGSWPKHLLEPSKQHLHKTALFLCDHE